VTPSHHAKIAIDATYGFRRLDPVPSPAELDAFYAEQYMELIEAGGRAPEIRRLLAAGPERDAELAWIQSTLYADIEAGLVAASGGAGRGRLVDVGCGTGDFLDYARGREWIAQGVEPSRLASQRARDRGLDVFHGTLEPFVADHRGGFTAVSLLNVLEHVPDPVGWVRDCRALLAPRGAIAIVVPNDFTPVQAAAASSLGVTDPWWVAAPDHVNYFDFASLERLLIGEGFAIAGRTCNFPMELFLLMGDDYVGDPRRGPECHAKRKRLEAGLPAELRRVLYQSFAAAGFGRNCIVFARRRD
jgi:SAM-dependent methyltransferase